jgi:hypothetical protein
MASDGMGFPQPGGEGGLEVSRRRWAGLQPAERASLIATNVQKIYAYGDLAANEILRTAREDFKRDFSEIGSKRMRLAVLRSLGEGPEDTNDQPTSPKPATDGRSIRPKWFNVLVAMILG